MKRLRVAVLEPIAGVGGAEISLLEVVRRLRDEIHFVLILPEDGPLRARAVAAGAEVRILPWSQRLMSAGERAGGTRFAKWIRAALALTALPGLARRVAALVDELQADLLLSNGIKAHVLAALARGRSPRPLVWYLRDGLEGRTLSALALRLFARRCTGAIAISRYVDAEAGRILGRNVPVKVIYNLVDFSRFHRRVPPPADLSKAPGEVWFGIIGALTPLKGQDIFLAAAARVAQRLPRSRFVIIGSNFYRTERSNAFEQRLRELAASADLQGRVEFLGQREDVAALLRLIDVLVQPNREPEALGRSILEAMACGVPVIATDKWGPAELIRHGETGLLSPVLDVDQLAANMLALGGDAGRRAALADAAEQWVTAELDATRILGEVVGFLRLQAGRAG